MKEKKPIVKSFPTAKGIGGMYQKVSTEFSKMTARAEEVVQRTKSSKIAQKMSLPTWFSKVETFRRFSPLLSTASQRFFFLLRQKTYHLNLLNFRYFDFQNRCRFF